MIPFTQKYHECSYCKKGTWFSKGITHKIYIRSKNKDRKFVAIAWYCSNCKMFETDEIMDKAIERKHRLEWGLKPEDNYRDKLNEVARMMGISV